MDPQTVRGLLGSHASGPGLEVHLPVLEDGVRHVHQAVLAREDERGGPDLRPTGDRYMVRMTGTRTRRPRPEVSFSKHGGVEVVAALVVSAAGVRCAPRRRTARPGRPPQAARGRTRRPPAAPAPGRGGRSCPQPQAAAVVRGVERDSERGREQQSQGPPSARHAKRVSSSGLGTGGRASSSTSSSLSSGSPPKRIRSLTRGGGTPASSSASTQSTLPPLTAHSSAVRRCIVCTH